LLSAVVQKGCASLLHLVLADLALLHGLFLLLSDQAYV
jgi:hypothetical protein